MSSKSLADLMQAVSLGLSQEPERVDPSKEELPKAKKTSESKPRNNRRKGNRSHRPLNKANESSLSNKPTEPSEEQFKSYPKASQLPKNNPSSTSVHEPSQSKSPSKPDSAPGASHKTPGGPKQRQPNSSSQKSSPFPFALQSSKPPPLYIAQYQPYSPSAQNCDILFGVFTSIAAAKACVETRRVGLHAQPGVNGAIEYSARGGRIRVLPKEFHMGEKGEVMGESRIERAEGGWVGTTERMSKLDEMSAVRGEGEAKGMVYLATDRKDSGELFFIGVFAEKYDAWEACLKYKSQLAYSSAVKDETAWIDEVGMPHVRGKIDGCGVHDWFVGIRILDKDN